MHLLKPFKLMMLPAAFLFLTACGTLSEIKKEAPEVNEVSPNTRFRIILPEDHRTGYLWQLTTDFDQALLEHTNTVWHGNEKGIYFDFKTKSGQKTNNSGEVVLTFINRKYTDTLNVKSFIIKILAK